MPQLLQTGSDQHSTHRSTASLSDQTNNQPDERREGRSGKARPEHGQETGQRGRYGGAEKHRRTTLTRVVQKRRCFPLHTPRSTNPASPACPTTHGSATSARNCETRGVRRGSSGSMPWLTGALVGRGRSGRAEQL